MSANKAPTLPSSNSFRKVRVFVASPGDVAAEKRALGKVIELFNRVHSDRLGVMLELKEWREVVSGMGRPEDVILDQLPVDTWDLFVGIL